MAHFEDLSPCTYFGGDSRALLAVGWLENGKPFPQGESDPAFLAALETQAKQPWAPVEFIGVHPCEFCPEGRRPMGRHNLFIPGDGVVFAAPALIGHYIREHAYRPPSAFVKAVLSCPPPGSTAFHAAIRALYRWELAPRGGDAAAAYVTLNIDILEGLEPVRRRPAMYVGDTGAYGLEKMVFEVIANALDQHLAGHAERLAVTVDGQGWVTVDDDGQGLPIPAGGAEAFLNNVFCCLHSGATLDGHHPHVHLTSVGVGLGVVNALSERMELEVRREGSVRRAAFARGVLVEPLSDAGSTSAHGTTIRFLPDPLIFLDHRADAATWQRRLSELAWLNPRLAVSLQGQSLHQPTGLAGWTLQLGGERVVPASLLSLEDEVDDVVVELALAWRRHARHPFLRSFVNHEETRGGSHTDGVLAALEAVADPGRLKGARKGLIGVVHVGLLAPRFQGPTKVVLHVAEARQAVEVALTRALRASAWWREKLGCSAEG
jgi:DNA gyrase B/Histidine kinase-, DNA gyrase B-, and HSP90-like ATPase